MRIYAALLIAALSLAPHPAPVAQNPSPEIDAILQRYVMALGGKAAIERHTTRLMKGTYALPTRNYSTPVDFYAKSPDKFAFRMTGQDSTAARGFNGVMGWSRNFAEEGLSLLEGPALEADRREADFRQPLHLRDRYPVMTVSGVDTLDGHAVTVVMASAPDGSRETMYFSRESGLLVRRDLPLYRGFNDVQVYLDNYRLAGDVRLPFTIRIVRTDRVFMNIFAFESVEHDVKIADSIFDPPRNR